MIIVRIQRKVGGNGQYFRGGVFGSIQGVAQCVQDLSLSDCQDCLSEANGRLRSECETSTWGDMYLEKCYIRFADQGNENFANNVIKLKKDLERVKKDAESAKSKAKSAMEKAEKKAEEGSIKSGYTYYGPMSIDDALAYLVDGTGHYFRVGVLGSVMQCVQDLNVSDCYDCVSEARGRVRRRLGVICTSGNVIFDMLMAGFTQ
ncbi:hypothetical protein L1987_79312 [Smallanthus sonchifolius]|uniref:Uncharacterized protein n=1 Tax=Smallanthus sonchifolius TaxID=185202 RepID=A0ACB8ZG57_9ASTR|nr:hypothetical protein L1987_79312 [Smallanthus sonchifolius]